MEDRTVAKLTTEGENTITKKRLERTLRFRYIVVLDESGYEPFQLEQ